MTMTDDLRPLVTIVTALHHAHFVPSTMLVEFTNRSIRRMPVTQEHELGGKGVLASDLKLLRHFGIDPTPCAEGLVDLAIGTGEQAEYEAFLIAQRSRMHLTPDRRPASPCHH
jgi:hypothetical protein